MIVYILTNEAMPGLIKIGRTDGTVPERMKSLDTCGVPLPFQCYYAARVTDSNFVENRLHLAFGDFRVRARREFFRLDPLRAKAALEIAALEDVTPRSDVIEEVEDRVALERAQQKAPPFRFSLADIPIGAEIAFAKDPTITAKVVSDRKVEFEGRQESVTGAAATIIQRLGYRWSAIHGPAYWLYEDETLAERRERVEAERAAAED